VYVPLLERYCQKFTKNNTTIQLTHTGNPNIGIHSEGGASISGYFSTTNGKLNF
jgi:hypothetical protein